MIVGQQKTIARIKDMLAPFNRVLILGCGTCVKTCFAGGEDEVATLAALLRLAFRKDGRKIRIEELTVERQCEDEFVREAAPAIARNEVVLSLACGAGVQMVADGKTGRLLGAQMVGREGAAHRINAAAVALHANMTVEVFGQSDLSYAPPFGPTWDPLLTAANQLLKKL